MGNAILTRKGGGAEVEGIVNTYLAKADDGTLLNSSRFVEFAYEKTYLYSETSAQNSGSSSKGRDVLWAFDDDTLIIGDTGYAYNGPFLRVVKVDENDNKTLGTILNIGTCSSNYTNSCGQLAKIDDTHFVWITGTSNNKSNVNLLEISGTTLTLKNSLNLGLGASNSNCLKYFGNGILLATGPKTDSAAITLDFWIKIENNALSLLSSSSGVSCSITNLIAQVDIDDTHVFRYDNAGGVQLVSFNPTYQYKTEGSIISVASDNVAYGTYAMEVESHTLKDLDNGVICIIPKGQSSKAPNICLFKLDLETLTVTLISTVATGNTDYTGSFAKFSEDIGLIYKNSYSSFTPKIYQITPNKANLLSTVVSSGISASGTSCLTPSNKAYILYTGATESSGGSTRYNLVRYKPCVKKAESSIFGLSKTSAYNGEPIEVYQIY